MSEPPEPGAPDAEGSPPGRWAPATASPGAIALLGLGTMFLASMAVGTMLGWLVDRWLRTSPIFTAIGLLAGLVIGGWSAWRLIRTFTHD